MIDNNFLLTTSLAQELYHDCAATLPIVDYHNHLDVKDLAVNRRYENLTELWIQSDPYKHRAMRILGIDEKYITGDGEAFEKFRAWMHVLPRLIGNPLYDWAMLEFKRVFDMDLNPESMDIKAIWNYTKEQLAKKEYSACNLLLKFNVEYCAPCALLTEDISLFQSLDNISPSMRGDNIVDITKDTIDQLNGDITTLDGLFEVISKRLNEFHSMGCRFADHALDNGFIYYKDDGLNHERFQRLLEGKPIADKHHLSSEILRRLASEYAKRDWTMQLHMGAQRYTSTKLRTISGATGGFAGIGEIDIANLTTMLDDFEKSPEGLPKTVLYTMNPGDNAKLSVLTGSYFQGTTAGKVQQGPAWWWSDHLYGIRETFESISSFGVLHVFIGMTTDSRSILSMVRHEYFRRALCGWLGEKAQKGEIPNSLGLLKELVYHICYYNAKTRLGELK